MRLVLQLTTGSSRYSGSCGYGATIVDDDWRVNVMLKSGQTRQLGQRYHGGKRKDHSCTAIGSQLFVVGGEDSNYE